MRDVILQVEPVAIEIAGFPRWSGFLIRACFGITAGKQGCQVKAQKCFADAVEMRGEVVLAEKVQGISAPAKLDFHHVLSYLLENFVFCRGALGARASVGPSSVVRQRAIQPPSTSMIWPFI